jgi:hypothetical protein
LTWDARLTASDDESTVRNVVDRDTSTVWHGKLAKDESAMWIECAFDAPVTIGSVVAGRGDEWSPRNNPELQIPDDDGGWKTIYRWKPKWQTVHFLEEAVTTRVIRLYVTGTERYPLAEFELYPPR